MPVTGWHYPVFNIYCNKKKYMYPKFKVLFFVLFFKVLIKLLYNCWNTRAFCLTEFQKGLTTPWFTLLVFGWRISRRFPWKCVTATFTYVAVSQIRVVHPVQLTSAEHGDRLFKYILVQFLLGFKPFVQICLGAARYNIDFIEVGTCYSGVHFAFFKYLPPFRIPNPYEKLN